VSDRGVRLATAEAVDRASAGLGAFDDAGAPSGGGASTSTAGRSALERGDAPPGANESAGERSARSRREVPTPIIRRLGLVEYEPTWRAMQRFTDERDASTPDEIWFLEHPPVFTLGMNASAAHVLAPGDIPVVQIDRGGQVTYHGPGQLVVYPLIDLRRAGLGIRDLVTALERSVIDLAAERGVRAEARRSAPGVYVDGKKLASVGIRVRRGASYHGLAVNVSLDLGPFGRINPCGYEGLQMTRFADLAGPAAVAAAADEIEPHLLRALGFSHTDP
jgi:lipoyl(octanoyl) transferase